MHSLPITYSLISNTPAPTHVHAPVCRRAGLPPGIFFAPNDVKCTLPPYHLSSPMHSHANTCTRQPCHAPACRCANTPTRQCANQRTDALMHRRTDAPMHRRTDAPMHRRTDAPMRLHTSDAPSDVPTHQCTTHRSADMPTCQHASTPTCANVHALSCQCAGLCTCLHPACWCH